MIKQQFIELYNAIEEVCHGDQQQANRLALLLRRNLNVNPKKYQWDGKHYLIACDNATISNGLNFYRSMWLLDLYGEFGSAVELAWRKGRCNLAYHENLTGKKFQPLESEAERA